jgi:hypothetical protein
MDAERTELMATRRPSEPDADKVAKVHAAVATLPPARRQLLSDRFGLGEEGPKKLGTLAGGLITRQGVQYHLASALEHVRRMVGSEVLS